jgi:hypothetical protein
VLHEQAGGALRRHGRQLRVDDPLEAPRRLARQLVPPGRTRDHCRVEVRGLQHDVDRADLRGLTDLRGRPAHHPGQPDGPRVVRDQQVVRVEAALDVVERGQRLPRARPPDDDAAGEPVRVVGVQRLAQLEHDVVGHVDDERDRPHPGGEQPPLHPPRAGRRRIDTVDAARDEPRARGVVQPHRPRVAVRGGHLHPAHGVDEVGVVRARQLAGQAADGEAVAPVRGDGQLDHRVVQAEQHGDVLAGRRRTGR